MGKQNDSLFTRNNGEQHLQNVEIYSNMDKLQIHNLSKEIKNPGIDRKTKAQNINYYGNIYYCSIQCNICQTNAKEFTNTGQWLGSSRHW